MKVIPGSLIIILFIAVVSACTGRRSGTKESEAGTDTTAAVPDTGYTGIKQYYSGEHLLKEVTFKNGIRYGETKTYYQDGRLYQTFWYENGLREDSGRWYYPDGKVFRSTPYKNDTMDGIQIQYYRTGKTRAKLGYNKGLRTPFLEEYTTQGRLDSDYPEIVSTIRDDYNSRGTVRINLELSNKATKVKFYRSEFYNGVFDTSKCQLLNTTNGKAYLDFKKTGSPQTDYVGIIAVILTRYSNNYLAYKKIELPYDDLK